MCFVDLYLWPHLCAVVFNKYTGYRWSFAGVCGGAVAACPIRLCGQMMANCDKSRAPKQAHITRAPIHRTSLYKDDDGTTGQPYRDGNVVFDGHTLVSLHTHTHTRRGVCHYCKLPHAESDRVPAARVIRPTVNAWPSH